MRNILSTAVIAFALALLVPSNGAEAVRLVALGPEVVQPVNASMSFDAAVERPAALGLSAPLGTVEPGIAWLMALGFLGAVILRRMRG